MRKSILSSILQEDEMNTYRGALLYPNKAYIEGLIERLKTGMQRNGAPFRFDHLMLSDILSNEPIKPDTCHFINPGQFLQPVGPITTSIDSTKYLAVNNEKVQERIHQHDKLSDLLVVSLANAYSVGGSPFHAMAQEETLFQQSDLYLHVPQSYPTTDAAPGLNNLGHSYRSNDIQFYQRDSSEAVVKSGDPLSVIFVAAPDFRGNKSLQDYCNGNGRDDYINLIALLTRLQLEHGIEQYAKTGRNQTIVFGALGCGAFQNNPYLIAAIMRSVFSENRYQEYFQRGSIHACFSIFIDEDILQKRGGLHLTNIFKEVMLGKSPDEVSDIILNAHPFDTNLAKQPKRIDFTEQPKALEPPAQVLENKTHSTQFFQARTEQTKKEINISDCILATPPKAILQYGHRKADFYQFIYDSEPACKAAIAELSIDYNLKVKFHKGDGTINIDYEGKYFFRVHKNDIDKLIPKQSSCLVM